MKSGFIAIIGRPNAGKSTLLNNLLNRKLAITTYKAQTTRNAILGILNEDDYQIVFVDTPGIHNAKSALGSYMNKEAYAQANGADLIFYLVDGNKGLQREDEEVLETIFSYDIPVFLLMNKIDEFSSDRLISRLNYANTHYDFAEIIPISALKKDNLDELLTVAKQYLQEGVQYFPEDAITNVSTRFTVSEIIREKVILNTYEEIPHFVAVNIEEYKETEKRLYIEATIIVNKDTHKGIVIGKQGTMLRKINEAVTKDITKLIGKKVILSLYVRVEEDWLNKEKRLFELGYFYE